MPPLTALQVDHAKPREKPYRIYDERGLYLEITPAGGKYWRLKYRFGGKEKRLALGVYPELKLADARAAVEIARAELRGNVDPGEKRKLEKRKQKRPDSVSFRAVADEWLALQKPNWAANTYLNAKRRFENYVYPYIGSRVICEIQPADILEVVRRIEGRNHIDTAHRVKQRCGQVFRYAIATGRADRDPAADLKGALAPLRTKHHAALTEPTEVATLMRSIAAYPGAEVTRVGLLVLAHTFVRPGELRNARWDEFDLTNGMWRIPANRMKMKLAHIVPLSPHVVQILKDLNLLTGASTFLFPRTLSNKRPISENTLNTALRRLGYTNTEMTSHGFRTIASTLLHERGWSTEIVERQLAHVEQNAVKAAYNRAEYLEQRTRMMTDWSNYLQTLINS